MEDGLEKVLYEEHLANKPGRVIECNFDWELRRPKHSLMMLKKIYQTPSEDQDFPHIKGFEAMKRLNNETMGYRSLLDDDYENEIFKGSFRIMRFRDDKPANAKKTAISVWHSIKNPIEKE